MSLYLSLTSVDDLSHRYLWGPGTDQLLAVDSTLDKNDDGTSYWVLTDHLGSVRDLLTLDGNHLADSHVSYDSFGNVTSTPGGTSILFGYTGRPVDGATGLQNNLHRWYDPAVGRWLSEDPIGFAAGDANLYRYVGNESTGYVDPDGLEGAPILGTNTYSGFTADNRAVSDFVRFSFIEQWASGNAAFVNRYINNHPLQQALLTHRVECDPAKSTVTLSLKEMVDIGATNLHVMGRLHGSSKYKPDNFLSQLKSLRTRARTASAMLSERVEFSRLSRSRLRGTTGTFTVRYRGDLTVQPDGKWEFKGQFRFEDGWDFKHSASRQGLGNGLCRAVRWGIPGNDFNVVSQWQTVQMDSTGVFRWPGSPLKRNRVPDTIMYTILGGEVQ